jgi:hypothetical protein
MNLDKCVFSKVINMDKAFIGRLYIYVFPKMSHNHVCLHSVDGCFIIWSIHARVVSIWYC